MGFIPVDRSGKQAYAYDTRNWKAKALMWLWRQLGKKILGETFYAEHITGEKTVYRNCVFRHCRFEGLRLVFIVDSYVEYDTDGPEFTNLVMCELSNLRFKRVKPLISEK